MHVEESDRAQACGNIDEAIESLARMVRACQRLLVLTGAGCSTESGIPDYRDHDGEWKSAQPVQYSDFVASSTVRQRYWARSLVGWKRMSGAAPNAAHTALAALENSGHMQSLITQNVDGLHTRAGSRRVIDLHGRLDEVVCLGCGLRIARGQHQTSLAALNPGWRNLIATPAPDGDAHLVSADYSRFKVPDCSQCGGILKPDVVFFGESIPPRRARRAARAIDAADGLLVAGSSLMVFSGYRFAREAARRNIPLAAVNLGKTRADALLNLKVAASCGDALTRLVTCLTTEQCTPTAQKISGQT